MNISQIKGKRVTIDGTPFKVYEVTDDMNRPYVLSSETLGTIKGIRIKFISSKKDIKLTIFLNNSGNNYFELSYLKDHPADEPLSIAGHWRFPKMDWFKWNDFSKTVSEVCSPYVKELTSTMNKPYFPDYWGVHGDYF